MAIEINQIITFKCCIFLPNIKFPIIFKCKNHDNPSKNIEENFNKAKRSVYDGHSLIIGKLSFLKHNNCPSLHGTYYKIPESGMAISSLLAMLPAGFGFAHPCIVNQISKLIIIILYIEISIFHEYLFNGLTTNEVFWESVTYVI